MNDTIQYACTACGNCCKGSIHLTLSEAIRFSGKFPIALHAVKQPSKEAMAREHWDYLKPLSHLMPIGSGETQRILTSLVSVNGSNSPCRQLGEDRLCNLHQLKKPGYCEAYPFDPFTPWRYQGDVWRGRSHICPDEAKSPQTPIIFNAGKAQPAPPKLLGAYLAEMQRDKAVKVRAFRMAYAHVLEREGPIAAQAIVIPLRPNDGPSRFVSVEWLITALLWSKAIDTPAALGFLDDQILQHEREPLAARHLEGMIARRNSLRSGRFESETHSLWELARHTK